MIQDVDTLVEYLKRRFEVDKIFLVGHSWGARLGLYSVQRHPENYIAYVGVGQELAAYEGELLSYQYTLDKGKEKNNVKALGDLKDLPSLATLSRCIKMVFGDWLNRKIGF